MDARQREDARANGACAGLLQLRWYRCRGPGAPGAGRTHSVFERAALWSDSGVASSTSWRRRSHEMEWRPRRRLTVRPRAGDAAMCRRRNGLPLHTSGPLTRVIPAKAGTHTAVDPATALWIPAFAGVPDLENDGGVEANARSRADGALRRRAGDPRTRVRRLPSARGASGNSAFCLIPLASPLFLLHEHGAAVAVAQDVE